MTFYGHTSSRPGSIRGKIGPRAWLRPAIRPQRRVSLVLLPITHTPPSGDTIGVEIPQRVQEALGLDDARSWVIVSEHNVDEWPTAGLATSGRAAGRLQLR